MSASNANTNPAPDFSGLSALILNCTLKPQGQTSNTEALLRVATAIMEKNGVTTEIVRPVDIDLPPGVYPDMTEHGFDSDGWPALRAKVLAADILLLGTPIWLGEESSVCRRVIERLYGESGKLNAMTCLYALQHLGYTIPPQADAGWIGAAGPGPSYADEGSGGPENDFTQRNTTFMTWNLMHMARILRDAGGFPAHGNQRSEWDAGCRFDHPNPDYR